MDCRTTLKHKDCGGELTTQEKNRYEPFDVCLPFGRTLHWDGYGLRISGRVSLPDGKYGVVTVTNGCITDAEEQPVCEYTPQPCTPAATGCGGEGEASVVLDPSADNILKFDVLGRLGAAINYRGEDGIIISGYGTADSPLVISYDGGEAARTYVRQGNLAVTVVGDGTIETPYTISHREGELDAGTYHGITVDDFGHIVAISTISGAITDILSTSLDVSATGSIYTVNMKEYAGVADFFEFGAYTAQFNTHGSLIDIQRNINLGAESLIIDPAYTRLTVTPYGSIERIEPVTVNADDQFCEVFNGARNETQINFATSKAGYFKITYRGLLTRAKAPVTTEKGFYPLPAPYSIRVGNRALSAYALYDTTRGGIVEIVALSDALYGPAEYTVQVNDTTVTEDPYVFTDVGFLTVELVGRGS